MLYTHSIEELIGLQDLIIKKIETNEKEIHIYGQLERKFHHCHIDLLNLPEFLM